jgi:hypothetical protein
MQFNGERHPHLENGAIDITPWSLSIAELNRELQDWDRIYNAVAVSGSRGRATAPGHRDCQGLAYKRSIPAGKISGWTVILGGG